MLGDNEPCETATLPKLQRLPFQASLSGAVAASEIAQIWIFLDPAFCIVAEVMRLVTSAESAWNPNVKLSGRAMSRQHARQCRDSSWIG